jgi:hypothetical protein
VLADQPPRSGLLKRPIVIGGRTVGSWKRTLDPKRGQTPLRIEARLFAPLDAAARERLEAAADRFGRFFGLPAALAV